MGVEEPNSSAHVSPTVSLNDSCTQIPNTQSHGTISTELERTQHICLFWNNTTYMFILEPGEICRYPWKFTTLTLKHWVTATREVSKLSNEACMSQRSLIIMSDPPPGRSGNIFSLGPLSHCKSVDYYSACIVRRTCKPLHCRNSFSMHH